MKEKLIDFRKDAELSSEWFAAPINSQLKLSTL